MRGVDDQDPAVRVHGVVSGDGGEALFVIVQCTTSVWAPPGRVRFAGLDPARTYRVEALSVAQVEGTPRWWEEGVTMSGRALEVVGVQAPGQKPEQSALLHFVAV